MEKPDFEEILYIVSGVIFLASLGVGLEVIGDYVIGDIMLFLSILWALSIFLFMRYVERKDSKDSEE
ncbi:hypothetical protein [Saccharolobus shibatae]|uniref:Uncharacterized protein n=2 Tax=Saccharolobus shibatae TaxID=2286 RepID=A0A8F5BYY3_9CREN|nr:hypothetical protein [Saccharolobus shibatae]QXJ27705.1 hypothetical protein J5U23_00572 [Saccharolobus shibatae B12]QXJ31028.1 hypothetical protein J5U21_00677 [Saccharolobus shibatae]QXJ34053.1 hypothetical protein J5U22_00598 [Saccharolobus shibatae]